MTNSQYISPDRVTGNNRSEQVSSRQKEAADRDRAPAATETVSDIGSPYGSSSDVQYSGESLDFGEAGEELI